MRCFQCSKINSALQTLLNSFAILNGLVFSSLRGQTFILWTLSVTLNKGYLVMKKYLFGLGAMLVGAGLMFVLMHGEGECAGRAVCSEFIGGGTTFHILEFGIVKLEL